MVKSLAGILALVLFFNVQVTNAQRVQPRPTATPTPSVAPSSAANQRVQPVSAGGGSNSSEGSCVYVEHDTEPNQGKGYCKNTNACNGMCKKKSKTSGFGSNKKTTYSCECKSNGCKYTLTVAPTPTPIAAGTGVPADSSATSAPTVTATCEGSCSDGSVVAGRVANAAGGLLGSVAGGMFGGVPKPNVSTDVKGLCKLIDAEPRSYEAGETGCDCVSNLVVNAP